MRLFDYGYISSSGIGNRRMANILIVDDSRTSRKILRSILESAGHTIVGEAANGEEGVKLYDELKPDLVTLDITMPVLDGIGALQRIKEAFPTSKAIMVTAAGQKTKMVEAVKYGADEFIPKPFEPEKLVAVVGKVIG